MRKVFGEILKRLLWDLESNVKVIRIGFGPLFKTVEDRFG